jgi:hypothetical protein
LHEGQDYRLLWTVVGQYAQWGRYVRVARECPVQVDVSVSACFRLAVELQDRVSVDERRVALFDPDHPGAEAWADRFVRFET